MPSLLYQDVIILSICLLFRSPSVFMNVETWEICILDNRFFDVTKFTSVTQISLLFSCTLSFPVVGLKSLLYLLLHCSLLTKVSFDTSRIDWIHALVPHRSCPLYHHFYSVGACMPRIILTSNERPLSTISDSLLLTIPVLVTVQILFSCVWRNVCQTYY
jgi:hypothetical protein